MKNDANYKKYINSLVYVKRSKNRAKVITIIGTSIKIPSEIAEAMNLRINQISAILKDLKKEELVVCLNETDRTGRLHQLTPKGLEVYKMLLELKKDN